MLGLLPASTSTSLAPVKVKIASFSPLRPLTTTATPGGSSGNDSLLPLPPSLVATEAAPPPAVPFYKKPVTWIAAVGIAAAGAVSYAIARRRRAG